MLGQHSVVRKQLCLGCLLPGGPGPQAVRPAGHMGALERCRRPPGAVGMLKCASLLPELSAPDLRWGLGAGGSTRHAENACVVLVSNWK